MSHARKAENVGKQGKCHSHAYKHKAVSPMPLQASERPPVLPHRAPARPQVKSRCLLYGNQADTVRRGLASGPWLAHGLSSLLTYLRCLCCPAPPTAISHGTLFKFRFIKNSVQGVKLPDKIQDTQLNLNLRGTTGNFLVKLNPELHGTDLCLKKVTSLSEMKT